MIDIFSKWDELENQVKTRNSFTPVFINVFSTPIVDMFIQNSINKDYAIILHINDKREIDINREVSGIRVKTYINNSVDSEYPSIVIENMDKELINIFKAFSATLFENLDEQLEYDDVENIINVTINSYKNYFSGKRDNLGDLEQQGLFGELLYLKEQLDEGNYDVLDCWEGIYKNKHDFVYKNKSVEIKTTRNQSRLDIHISNENQLDNTFVNELNLVVYRLEKVSIGKTIFDLYKEILSVIPTSKHSLFKSKLIKVGMDFDEVDNLIAFRPVKKFVFDVDDTFPKIDKMSCGDRIFEVKYYISLDGIEGIEEVSYNA